MRFQLSKFSYLKKLKIINFSLILFFLPVNSLYAAAPKINGNVDITITAGNIINVAMGIDSIAQVGIGSVADGDVAITSFKTDITVGDVVNRAEAAGACSQVLIGTVGFPLCGGGVSGAE